MKNKNKSFSPSINNKLATCNCRVVYKDYKNYAEQGGRKNGIAL